MMAFFVYILASRPHGAIYIGSTHDLRERVTQHCAHCAHGHTGKYNILTLVYFEQHGSLGEALLRERRLKRWRRAWKDALIAEANPGWRDICDQIPL
jgi:putative endonuclease